MTAKEKKSGGRKRNTNCYTFNDIERTVKFIQQYAVLHGLLLPGKTPGVRKDGVILMPSSETKVKHTSLLVHKMVCITIISICIMITSDNYIVVNFFYYY